MADGLVQDVVVERHPLDRSFPERDRAVYSRQGDYDDEQISPQHVERRTNRLDYLSRMAEAFVSFLRVFPQGRRTRSRVREIGACVASMQ
jgi:hypothetical protein